VTISRAMRWLLAAVTAVVLTIVYVPLSFVLVNSFNASRTCAWPPQELTLDWWHAAASS
jgi:putative spermidine/putrescine transport system permease protein